MTKYSAALSFKTKLCINLYNSIKILVKIVTIKFVAGKSFFSALSLHKLLVLDEMKKK